MRKLPALIAVAGLAAGPSVASSTWTSFLLDTPVPCAEACGDALPAPFGPCGTPMPDASSDDVRVTVPAGRTTIAVEWFWFPDTPDGVRVYLCEEQAGAVLSKAAACLSPPPFCQTGNAFVASVTPGSAYLIRAFNRYSADLRTWGRYSFGSS